jgi:hypothetical protein
MAQMNVEPNTSLFYSGVTSKHAIAWRAKSRQYKLLSETYKKPRWEDQWVNDADAHYEFVCRASCAFARLSAGVVCVVLPNDGSSSDRTPGSTWYNHEWPYLRNEPGKENAKVERVLRLSPDDFSKAEVIYERKKELATAMAQEEDN